MIRYLPLADINPFDATHVASDQPPGFVCVDKVPQEHWLGALHCKTLIAVGARIRPIAVCSQLIAPLEQRDAFAVWQRIDGFKRYWGHKLAGATHVPCVIYDTYSLGPQHGQSMEIEEDEWARLSTS